MKKLNEKNVVEIIDILKSTYPNAKCSLDFKTPFEMLVAVCLSAQCTDERVNKTTPSLFAKYDTPEDFANANVKDIEKIIKPCGFYKNKAKNLVNAGKIIVEKFDGKVPDDIEKLQTIPGVGRKSANVIMLEAFNKPEGIAVDWKDVNHLFIYHGREVCTARNPKCEHCELSKYCEYIELKEKMEKTTNKR